MSNILTTTNYSDPNLEDPLLELPQKSCRNAVIFPGVSPSRLPNLEEDDLPAFGEKETRRKKNKALRNFKYRQRHREEIKRSRREYELRNKEELAKKRRDRYLLKKDRVIASKHEYYKLNREKILAKKRASYDPEARVAYYNKNRGRILARKKTKYNKELATAKHRQWREKVYSDPEKARAYRQKRRDSVIKSMGKRAGVILIEKGKSAPMLGTGYVPVIEAFIKDPEKAIIQTYKNFGVLDLFRAAEKLRDRGKTRFTDIDGLPVSCAVHDEANRMLDAGMMPHAASAP